SWWTIVWLGPSVRATALVKSFPTPRTSELFRVVVSPATAGPAGLFAVPVAPVAPEAFVPLTSVPVKLTTVIEPAGTLFAIVAVTVTLVNGDGAKARQISE